MGLLSLRSSEVCWDENSIYSNEILTARQGEPSICSVANGILLKVRQQWDVVGWKLPHRTLKQHISYCTQLAGQSPFRWLAEVQNSQARQMLHGNESPTWLKSFCHTSPNLGHYSWAEPVSQQQLSNWLSQIRRQPNMAEDRAISLNNGGVCKWQK